MHEMQANFNNSINLLYQTIKAQENQFTGLSTEVESLHRQNEEFQNHNVTLSEKNDELRKKNDELRKENDALTKHIRSKTENGPILGDMYYITEFKQITGFIQNWAATYYKEYGADPSSPDYLNQLPYLLSDVGEFGRNLVEKLNSVQPGLAEIYSIPRSRIVLIRHIIGWFLFDRVFDPFAFGVDKQHSKGLRWTADGLFSTGMSRTEPS
jgi:FtsZ-binding cell division protein ZapB